MRYYLLLLLSLSGCTSVSKDLMRRCVKPSYDANAKPCNSPYDNCDPSDTEIRCEALYF